MSINSPILQKSLASLPISFEDLDIDTGIILGSGLNNLVDRFDLVHTIPYAKINEFPNSTAPGHNGQLTIARHQQQTLAIFQGRFHLYEGWRPEQICLPIYLLKTLGAKRVIMTNAAGALDPEINVAELMVIEDHINFTGHNPLIGENDDALGPRFPDMSQAYNQELRDLATHCAEQLDIKLNSGIYAGVLGPSLETSAERRFLRQSGCNAVGMSTVLEVIAANYCQMPVLAISAIVNAAHGLADQQPDTMEQALGNAKVAGEKMRPLIVEILSQF